jgi:tetratricopeptide (TPR) repeat protein
MRWIAILLLLLSFPSTLAQGVEDDAKAALAQAQLDIQEMQEFGLAITYVNDTLREAQKAMSEGNFPLVIEYARKIRERKEDALRIMDSIRALELRITEVSAMGLDTQQAEEKLAKAKKYFQMENYDEAEEWIFRGNKDLYDVEAEYTLLKARYDAAKENIVAFLKEKWKGISATFAILLLVGVVSYNQLSVIKARKRAEELEMEREIVEELLKKTQADYFKEGKISREVYEIKSRKYRERLREIEEEIGR